LLILGLVPWRRHQIHDLFWIRRDVVDYFLPLHLLFFQRLCLLESEGVSFLELDLNLGCPFLLRDAFVLDGLHHLQSLASIDQLLFELLLLRVKDGQVSTIIDSFVLGLVLGFVLRLVERPFLVMDDDRLI